MEGTDVAMLCNRYGPAPGRLVPFPRNAPLVESVSAAEAAKPSMTGLRRKQYLCKLRCGLKQRSHYRVAHSVEVVAVDVECADRSEAVMGSRNHTAPVTATGQTERERCEV
jgi:hypothetical protein